MLGLTYRQVRDGQAAQFGRAAALAAGYPNTTAACRVNRFCSSGLAATQNIANEIAAGSIDIGERLGNKYRLVNSILGS